MRALNHKLLRDLRHNLGTLLSVVTIMAIAASTFVGLGSAQRILRASQHAYYRQYRLADFWIDVKKAPLSAVDRLAEMPQVDAIEGRVTFDVIVDLPDEPRPISARLISAPTVGFDRTINGIHLVRGSGFSETRDEEAIVSEAFAAAHHLAPGDRVRLILSGKRQAFTIVGTAISPEYVYMVRGPGDLLPDPKHFGVFYIKARYARQVLDFQDACNQIVGRLTPDAVGDVDLLLDRMDRELEPFGVYDTVPRKRQASYRFLSDEITGLRVSGVIMPVVFLGAAALVLNILIIRLVERQRTTIGTLKSLGYHNRRITAHYLAFAAAVGLGGGAVGAALGVGLSRLMMVMYAEFFQFPRFLFRVYADLIAEGAAICVIFAVVGAVRGVAAVIALQPAEAMRQRPPQRGGAIWLEQFTWLWQRLSFRSHLALRSLMRNRLRTTTSIVANAMSIAIIFMSMVSYDAFLYLVDYQFEQVAHSDVDIGMSDARPLAVMYEAQRLPGVDAVEPLFGMGCDLANGRCSRRVSISGLSAAHQLTTPRTADGEPIDIPQSGLVLSRKLAELLDVRAGEPLHVTPVRGRRETRTAYVAAIADTYLGIDCYADIGYLSSLVGEAYAVNAIQMKTNAAATGDLFRVVKQLPNAQNLAVRADTRANIEKTLVETSLVSIGILVIFAGAIALGAAVTNTLIEIGDRGREIATLRVLGYHPGQIAGIMFRQDAVTFGLGTLLALPMGYAMTVAMAHAYDSELYRMPVVVRGEVVALTLLLAASFLAVSQSIVLHQVRKLDWLERINVKE